MTNLNLMTHCGAHQVPREALFAIPEPVATGSRHTPIPHSLLLEEVEQQISNVRMTTIQEVHALSHENMRYFGMLEVAPTPVLDPVPAEMNTPVLDPDYSIILGLRNANDKSFKAGLVVGSGVFVCDNLCFSGEIKVDRKHTPNILLDLPNLIAEALQQVAALKDFQDHRIATYKEHVLTDAQVNDLLIRALDADVVASSKIGQILSEWREPRHPEFRQAGPTTWRLMNAFTEVLKPRHESNDLFALPAKTEQLHVLLDGICGLRRDFN